MLSVTLVWMRDRNQFDFAKLMLAQHAACIAAGGTGLAAETIGQGGNPDRQVLLGQDFPITVAASGTSAVGISHRPSVV